MLLAVGAGAADGDDIGVDAVVDDAILTVG